MCITKSQHTLLKLQLFLKKYFIYYYIETFLPRYNFFDILLAFVFFLKYKHDKFMARRAKTSSKK